MSVFVPEKQAQASALSLLVAQRVREFILEKYSFDYFHVTIKPGYYEGFTLDIENNCPVAFDGLEDKRAAQREITSLKKCLIECAGAGMVQCSPGWCTGYNNYRGTCEAIGAAIVV